MLIDARKVKKMILYFLSTSSALVCCLCLTLKVFELSCNNLALLELFSMSFIMSEGDLRSNEAKINVADYDAQKIINLDIHKPDVMANTLASDGNNNIADESLSKDHDYPDIKDFSIPHNDGENTFKIIESHFGDSGIKYENFYVNNKSGMDLNIAEELRKRPDVNIKKDGTPQVLVYHTHTCEAFMDKDQGFYYESFYPRTEDKRYSVVRVGDAICESLKKAGISCIHDTTCHDSPSFSGSYRRSAETIDRNLAEHPSIQVTIDIHRDTIGNNERGKIKPTFKVNGKKAAQIMIMAGCDLDGSMNFPDWEYNLRFALRLQKASEKLYPGMTRSMFFGPVKYNMNKTHASLLIEVGTEVNTLNEAVYTGTLLGHALAKTFEGL